MADLPSETVNILAMFNTKPTARRKLKMKTGAICETETFSALVKCNISELQFVDWHKLRCKPAETSGPSAMESQFEVKYLVDKHSRSQNNIKRNIDYQKNTFCIGIKTTSTGNQELVKFA